MLFLVRHPSLRSPDEHGSLEALLIRRWISQVNCLFGKEKVPFSVTLRIKMFSLYFHEYVNFMLSYQLSYHYLNVFC
jgi:hypothetical protein